MKYKNTFIQYFILFFLCISHCLGANAVTEHDIELPILDIRMDADSFNLVQTTLSKDIEPTCVISYIEDGDTLLTQTVRFQIAGSGTRWGHLKSYELKAKKDLGKKNIKNLFFDTDISKYKSLKLRNVACLHHKDYPMYTGISFNVFMAICGRNSVSKIDYQETKQIVLFINGEYYGIYDLTETSNQKYLKSKYDLEEEDIHYCKMGAINSSTIDWIFNTPEDSIAFFDLRKVIDSPTSTYEEIQEVMDIDNVIDYYLFEIFAQNFDWITNNCIIWKKKGNSKWKFILNDFDFVGLIENNSVMWSLRSEARNELFLKALFQKLNTFNEFNARFADRMLIAYGTYLRDEKFSHFVDSVANNIRYEIPYQAEFYEELCTRDNETNIEEYHYYDNWDEAIELLSKWSKNKKEAVQYDIKNFLGETNEYVDLQIESNGQFLLNDELVKEFYDGFYFKNRPMAFTNIDGSPCQCEVTFTTMKDGFQHFITNEAVTIGDDVTFAQINVIGAQIENKYRGSNTGIDDALNSHSPSQQRVFDLQGRERKDIGDENIYILNGEKRLNVNQ